MRHIIQPLAFILSAVSNGKNALPIKFPINELPCILAILHNKRANTVQAVPRKTPVRLFMAGPAKIYCRYQGCDESNNKYFVVPEWFGRKWINHMKMLTRYCRLYY